MDSVAGVAAAGAAVNGALDGDSPTCGPEFAGTVEIPGDEVGGGGVGCEWWKERKEKNTTVKTTMAIKTQPSGSILIRRGEV